MEAPSIALRLTPSRMWIPAIAAAVIGLITLQLVHLQFAHGAGTAIERQEALQRQDAALNVEDSVLSSAPHIEAAAQKLGMAMVAEGALHILNGRGPVNAGGAAQSVTEPAAGNAVEQPSYGAPAQQPSESAAAEQQAATATEPTSTQGTAPTESGGAAPTTSPTATEPAAATPESNTGGASVPAR